VTSRRHPQKSPDYCPVCGEGVPSDAPSCPECGADERSGWNEEADFSPQLGLPSDDFDYEKFTEQEFGSKPSRISIKPIWWITTVILIVIFLWTCFRR
jgi:hypothetical protein